MSPPALFRPMSPAIGPTVPSAIGIVTGLRAEARLAATVAAPDRVGVAGGCAGRAYAVAKSLAAAGARGLVSFGIAGGLDPALRPGDLVLARAVIRADGRVSDPAWATDPGWRGRLARRLPPPGLNISAPGISAPGISAPGISAPGPPTPVAVVPVVRSPVASAPAVVDGLVAGSDHALLHPRDKQALAIHNGAVAVDMESHGVARAAAEAGLPLLVIRAIADPADRTVPALALAGMGPTGETRVMPVIAGLLSSPGQLPALLAVARDARAAMAALRCVASFGGPDLGF